MEKRAAILALVLTLPLALYGVPFAYALTAASNHYTNERDFSFPALSSGTVSASCNLGDSATGGGYSLHADYAGQTPKFNVLTTGTGTFGLSTHAPSQDTWYFEGINENNSPVSPSVNAGDATVAVYVVCETPVTVAGVGVPEFGSLYAAIALGAVAYFMLSRRFARAPTSLQA